MIGYFVKSGDAEMGKIFNVYRFSYSDFLKEKLAGKKYSEDLELILIEYHLEGKFLSLPDKEIRVKAYRRNEHSVAVVIGVPQEFVSWTEIEKKKFLITTTLEAVIAVKSNLSKKTNFDLQKLAELYTDIKIYSKMFLKDI